MERLLDRGPVLAGQVGGAALGALGRRPRIELEGPPGHLDVLGPLELRERGLEAALAHVAPGAGDVRPDLDVHARARG
jgi:hypothetical protein